MSNLVVRMLHEEMAEPRELLALRNLRRRQLPLAEVCRDHVTHHVAPCHRMRWVVTRAMAMNVGGTPTPAEVFELSLEAFLRLQLLGRESRLLACHVRGPERGGD